MISQAILVQGQCSEEKIRAMFQKCKPVKGKLGISEFEQLVGMMSETEKQTKAQIESQFGIEEGDEEEDDDEEVEVVIEAPQSMTKKSRVGVVNLTPDNQRTDFIEVKPTLTSSEEEDEDDDDEDDDDDDEDDDEELLSNVFKSLAGDKTYVAAKDLMNWDIVLELMGEVNTSIYLP